jgi:hypothetical protein
MDEDGRQKTEGRRQKTDGRRMDEDGRQKSEGRRQKTDGRRKAEDGKRKTEDGKRKTENGKRKAEGGKRKTEGGRRKTEDGRRKTEDGRRKTEDGGRKTEDGRQMVGRQQVKVSRRKTERWWRGSLRQLSARIRESFREIPGALQHLAATRLETRHRGSQRSANSAKLGAKEFASVTCEESSSSWRWFSRNREFDRKFQCAVVFDFAEGVQRIQQNFQQFREKKDEGARSRVGCGPGGRAVRCHTTERKFQVEVANSRGSSPARRIEYWPVLCSRGQGYLNAALKQKKSSRPAKPLNDRRNRLSGFDFDFAGSGSEIPRNPAKFHQEMPGDGRQAADGSRQTTEMHGSRRREIHG